LHHIINNYENSKIGHDGAGADSNWLLKDVEVHEKTRGKSYFIKCNQWLSTERGDGLTIRKFNVDEATTKISSYTGSKCTLINRLKLYLYFLHHNNFFNAYSVFFLNNYRLK
jgi:hypothetical protein